MKRSVLAMSAVVGIFISSYAVLAAQNDSDTEQAIESAMESLNVYMAAFNSRDSEAWAATLNYPHVRIASGDVRVWQDAEEFAAYMDFDAFAERFGWDHSHWIRRDVVGATPNKVHIMTTFQRFNDKNEPIATFDSLYIVTLVDGHWGTQARSSSAP